VASVSKIVNLALAHCLVIALNVW